MRLSHFAAFLSLLAVAGVLLLPTAGCGAKKKGAKALTIKQQLEKAEAEGTPDRQAAALLKVARAQWNAGDRSGAKETAKTAFNKVKGDGDPSLFALRLVDAAEFFARITDKKQVREALKLALGWAEKIEDPIRKTKVLAAAGGIFGNRDKDKGLADSKLAKATMEQAAEVANGVEERFRAEALAAVALGYAKAGMPTEAGEKVVQLEESARALEEPRAKAEALAAAADVHIQIDHKDEALKLLDEAAVTAKSVERSESRAYALLAVAEITAAVGNTKKALALLKEADKSADKVADPEQQKIVVAKVRSTMAELEKKK